MTGCKAYPNRRRKLRGFTLMEMMISMALVLLVTVAVVATVQVSYRTIRRDHVEQCAIREAENLVICFESDDPAAAMKLLYGEGKADIREDSVYVRFSSDGTPLAPNDDSFAWAITARKDGSTAQLVLLASYPTGSGGDGEEIYSASFSLKQ